MCGILVMELHVFSFLKSIEGTIEKVQDSIQQFDNIWQLSKTCHILPTATCFCYFVIIKSLTLLLFPSIFYYYLFFYLFSVALYGPWLELCKLCCSIKFNLLSFYISLPYVYKLSYNLLRHQAGWPDCAKNCYLA